MLCESRILSNENFKSSVENFKCSNLLVLTILNYTILYNSNKSVIFSLFSSSQLKKKEMSFPYSKLILNID